LAIALRTSTEQGAHGYDAIAARKAHSELIGFRSDLGILAGGSNIRVIQSLGEYVEVTRRGQGDANRDWKSVIEIVKDSTGRVDSDFESGKHDSE
jgi:hypothetical protein